MATSSTKNLIPIGEGFWNIRGHFKIALGLVDIGTHMSVAKLPNDKYLIIDAISLSDQLKSELRELTDNGKKIEAILMTHPFHTLAVNEMHSLFPDATYYGAPRHLKLFPNIKWSGDLNDCHVRDLWKPAVEIRIPAGAEFVAPLPESNNHFSCAFVFHKQSSTLHVDDTIFVAENPGFLLKLFGYKKGSMSFHPTLKSVGLLPHPEAPFQFRDFILGVLKDWAPNNIVTAHLGNKIGGTSEQLAQLTKDAEPLFVKLSEKRKKPGYKPEVDEKEHNYNVEGNSCG